MLRSTPAVLVAVLALGALAAASASAALPEFKVPGAKYPVSFTGTSTAVHLQENGGGSYTCTSSSIAGEITGPKEVGKVVMKFAGALGCGGFCQQTGHEGSWETKELKGRIAYLAKTGKKVGLLLEAATEPVATCPRTGGTQIWKIEGSLIGEIGPVLRSTKAYVLAYEKSGATQALRHFEGEELLHNLQTLAPGSKAGTEMGLETHEPMSLTTAQAIEIVA
jgi:hypothetical protein